MQVDALVHEQGVSGYKRGPLKSLLPLYLSGSTQNVDSKLMIDMQQVH